MYVRGAQSADSMAIRRLIDGAMLERPSIDAAVERGQAFVAVQAGHIVGTILLRPLETGSRIVAIAVNRRHRACGIGGLLVSAVLTRTPRLVATFSETVAPFYRSLEFTITPTGQDRYRGELRRCLA